VTVGGHPAYISYISPAQVNAQVPSDIGTGPQQVALTPANGLGSSAPIFVNTTVPGLFAPAAWKLGDNQYTAATFTDGTTYVLATGAVAGVNSRPAKPGEIIILYGTGFGPVTPNTDAGQIAQGLTSLTYPVKFYVNGTAAAVDYAGLAPGSVGLYQFNIVVPNVQGGDAVPLTFNQAGVDGAQVLYVAIQN